MVSSASQYVPTEEPLARSNSTVHELVELAVPFAIVYLPWYPVPQSESLLNVAVSDPSLAARLQSLATGGAIVVSAPTYTLTEGYFSYTALGTAQVKGVSEPVPLYQVLGVGPLRTRIERHQYISQPPLTLIVAPVM